MKDQQKKDVAIRSSAAEYLTFVASTGESDASYEMRYLRWCMEHDLMGED